MTVLSLLALNAFIVTLCFLSLWLLANWLKDVSFIDAWWALGIVVIAGVSFVMSPAGSPHAALIAALCTIWGLRLGFYLLWRWRKQGPDRRYVRMNLAPQLSALASATAGQRDQPVTPRSPADATAMKRKRRHDAMSTGENAIILCSQS